MTQEDNSPQLLPGISGRSWDPVFRVLVWVAAASSLMLFAFGVLRLGPGSSFAWFIPLVVSYGLLYAALAVRHIRAKSEVAAGYTTLTHENPTLPQLDPKTGEVLRRAGEPYLPRSRRQQVRDTTPGTLGVARPSLLKRLTPALIGTVGAPVFLLIISLAVGLTYQGQVAFLLVAVPCILLVFGGAILIGSVRVRRILIRLQLAAPSEFAFVFASSKGLVSALQALVPVNEPPAAGLIRARQATASPAGLTFWQGNPPTNVATLPWSKVIAIQQDLISIGQSSNPTVVITFRDEEADEVVALPLMNAEANYLSIRSVAESRWIAWELNQIRTAKTSPRLI